MTVTGPEPRYQDLPVSNQSLNADPGEKIGSYKPKNLLIDGTKAVLEHENNQNRGLIRFLSPIRLLDPQSDVVLLEDIQESFEEAVVLLEERGAEPKDDSDDLKLEEILDSEFDICRRPHRDGFGYRKVLKKGSYEPEFSELGEVFLEAYKGI